MQARARELAYERGHDAGATYRASHVRGRLGRERSVAAARAVLDQLGFRAREGVGGEVLLSNCPFEAVAERDPDVVCNLNRSLVSGVLDGLGTRGVVASLERAPSRCCVVLRTSSG
jgi:predicted ArsR family transcriptional regulator